MIHLHHCFQNQNQCDYHHILLHGLRNHIHRCFRTASYYPLNTFSYFLAVLYIQKNLALCLRFIPVFVLVNLCWEWSMEFWYCLTIQQFCYCISIVFNVSYHCSISVLILISYLDIHTLLKSPIWIHASALAIRHSCSCWIGLVGLISNLCMPLLVCWSCCRYRLKDLSDCKVGYLNNQLYVGSGCLLCQVMFPCSSWPVLKHFRRRPTYIWFHWRLRPKTLYLHLSLNISHPHFKVLTLFLGLQ